MGIGEHAGGEGGADEYDPCAKGRGFGSEGRGGLDFLLFFRFFFLAMIDMNDIMNS